MRVRKGDYDGDGLTNGEEYTFGLDPTLRESASPITIPENSDRGQIQYTRRDPALTNRTETVWISSDLLTWQPAAEPDIDLEAVDPATHIQTVRVTVKESGSQSTLFLRVQSE